MRRHLQLVLIIGLWIAASPTFAAEVTFERLINADREPQNWLMNHRTYNGQRFSPLARIARENVKSLKLAYAVGLAGGSGNEFIEATPLAEDGFLYITDSWGVLYKIDGRSGNLGRIVWRMDPHQEKQGINRGAAFWGNLVISAANWPARIVAKSHVGFPDDLAGLCAGAEHPAATAACATGSRRSMRQRARYCGASSRFRRLPGVGT